MRIKKGDTVLVIAGKDKGVTGKVLAVDTNTARVTVEGVNRVKKHTREELTAWSKGRRHSYYRSPNRLLQCNAA